MLVIRQGTGQGSLAVAREVAEEIAEDVAEQVARVVPRQVLQVVTPQAMGTTTGEA